MVVTGNGELGFDSGEGAELAMRDEPNVWVKVPKCALM